MYRRNVYVCTKFNDLLADGGWSSWGAWDDCSTSCGGGITRRQRLCDNPSPSAFGHPCIGNDEHTVQCNTLPCSSKLFFHTEPHILSRTTLFVTHVHVLQFPIHTVKSYCYVLPHTLFKLIIVSVVYSIRIAMFKCCLHITRY